MKIKTPATLDASERQVTFTDYSSGGISLENVLLIVNSTHNTIIYNFADPSTGATGVAGNVITLDYNTSSAMSDSDKILAYYDDTTATQAVSGSVTADLGANNDVTVTSGNITVSGTVTANAGTNLNTSLLSTAAHQVTQNSSLGDILTTLGEIDDNTYKTMAATHTTGSQYSQTQWGTLALGVRNDTLATLVSDDNDYAPFQVNDIGALFIDTTDGGNLYNTLSTIALKLTQQYNLLNGIITAGAAIDVANSGLTELAAAINSDKVDINIASGNITGFATSANQSTIIGHIDGLELTVSGIKTNLDTIEDAIGTDNSTGPSKAMSVAGTESGGDLQELRVDSDGHLQVDVLSGGGSATQYTEGDTDSSITGTAMLWEDTSETLRSVSAAKPLPINIISGGFDGNVSNSALTELAAAINSDRLDVNIANGGFGGAVTNAGTFAVQVDGDALTSLQLLDDVIYADDADFTLGTSKGIPAFALASTGQAVQDGDVGALTMDQDGALHISDGGNALTVDGTVAVSNTVRTISGSVSVVLADGTDTTFGAKGDDKSTATDTTEVTAMSVLKQISASVQSIDSDQLADSHNVTVDNTVPVSGTFWQTTQPVSGTVTAELSSTDNTVLDNIKTNTDDLSAIKTALQILDDWDDSNYANVNLNFAGSDAPTGGGAESGALRVTIANDSTGVVSIDDGGGAITVDGTVDLGSTATNHLSEIEGAVETIEGAIDSGQMQVDVVASLPAGTNNIGDVDIASIAAGDNNIGNVDIASAIPAGDNNIGNVDIASALPAGSNAIGKLAANSGVDIGDVDVTSVPHPTGLATLVDYDEFNVATGGAAVVLSDGTNGMNSTVTGCKEIILEAGFDNSGFIMVGFSSSTNAIGTLRGIRLGAGDIISLPVASTDSIFTDASAAGQKLRAITVK